MQAGNRPNPLASILGGALGKSPGGIASASPILGAKQPPVGPLLRLAIARAEAEKRFPFIQQFSDVRILPAQTENKGGLGEFIAADEPSNPFPGQDVITVGPNSEKLQGGIADTIVADMVHVAANRSPKFQKLMKQLRQNLSKEELALARRRYENEFKGKFTGSNFETFENFLNTFWLEGAIQHLLLPENSEIEEFRSANPKAQSILDEIETLFTVGE